MKMMLRTDEFMKNSYEGERYDLFISRKVAYFDSLVQNMAYTLSNRATELIKELKRSDWIPKYNVSFGYCLL